MPLKQIAIASHLSPDNITEVVLDKKKIILVNHEGNLKAFQGTCPHEGAALADGHIENGHIVCPLHRRNFSCETGKHPSSSLCLKSYALVQKDNGIFINTDELSSADDGQQKNQPVRTINTLPAPKGDFLLGHLNKFKVPDRHLVLERWAEEQGDLYQINFVGKKFIVSANTEINRQILKNRPQSFRRFNKINEVMEEMGIVGTFNAEGDTWARHRKLTAEALNYKNLQRYFSIIARITDRLLQRWTKYAQEHKEINVQKELMRYTVDITTTLAFGHDANTLEKDDDVIQQHMEKIFPMINQRITSPLPIWRYIKSKSDKEFDLALSETKKAVDRFIAEARERLNTQPDLKENPTNFLEALLVQQQTEGNFSDKEVFGNVFTILLAGEDTTSNSISWILYFLASNPEMAMKVRKEADELFPQMAVPDSMAVANELKYTEAVALEVLRLKPVTPVVYMEALEDVIIEGLSIRTGETVMLQNKVAQTQEKNFVAANKFVPERWIAGKCPYVGAHKPEVIQTFGNGPRFCPGKNLAMLEMVVATAMICKNFDLELAVSPEAVKEVFAFTMYPDNLILRLKERVAEVVG
jgi:cytochrome P450/nitrite reductase/ring-hydroxylating ferredoxin subunit